jgi:hypothetical protein
MSQNTKYQMLPAGKNDKTPLLQKQFNNWKRNGRFNQGMAVIDSQLWRSLQGQTPCVCRSNADNKDTMT